MKLNILQKALRYYLLISDAVDDKRDALAAIEELAEIKEAVDTNASAWDDDVTVVSLDVLDNVLNILTYDTIGKLLRTNKGDVSLDQYVRACKESVFGIDSLTVKQLNVGYEILRDLWWDNEKLGDNNLDGTFADNACFLRKYDSMSLLTAYIMRELSTADKNLAELIVCKCVDALGIAIEAAVDSLDDGR